MQPTNDGPASGPRWEPPPPPWGTAPPSPPSSWPGTPTPPPPVPDPATPVADGVPARPAPRPPDSASPPGSHIGAVAAVAGLAGALAPRAEWLRVDLEAAGTMTSLTTTGWGSAGLESTLLDVPDDLPGNAWGAWALAGIPDGAIATLLALVVGLAGIRVLLAGPRGGRPAATVAGGGVLGLGWMVLSWFTAQATFRDYEGLMALGGASEQQIDEAMSTQVGWGFVVATAAFAVAAIAGFAALWSSTTRTPAAVLAESAPIPDPAGPGDRPMPSWGPPRPPVPPVVADALGPPRERDAARGDGRPPSPSGWR